MSAKQSKAAYNTKQKMGGMGSQPMMLSMQQGIIMEMPRQAISTMSGAMLNMPSYDMNNFRFNGSNQGFDTKNNLGNDF